MPTHAVALDCGGAELIVLKADLLTETGDVMQAETSLEKALKSTQWMLNYEALSLPEEFLKGVLKWLKHCSIISVWSIDHPELHIVEGLLHLARADRLRDGTGETDQIHLGQQSNRLRSLLN